MGPPDSLIYMCKSLDSGGTELPLLTRDLFVVFSTRSIISPRVLNY